MRRPATGEVVHSVCTATVDEVDASVRSARRALDGTRWSYDLELRTRVLFQFVELIRWHANELTDALQRESGKRHGVAEVEARNSAKFGGVLRRVHALDSRPVQRTRSLS